MASIGQGCSCSFCLTLLCSLFSLPMLLFTALVMLIMFELICTMTNSIHKCFYGIVGGSPMSTSLFMLSFEEPEKLLEHNLLES